MRIFKKILALTPIIALCLFVIFILIKEPIIILSIIGGALLTWWLVWSAEYLSNKK